MNKNLLLGVPNIDFQHSELFRSFRHLLSIRTNEEAVADALSQLPLQIYDHFETEEDFMFGLDMPSEMLLQHEQAHTQIVEELAKFHLETMDGLKMRPEEIINRIAAHIHHHIIEFDLLLKSYIP